MEWGYTSTFPNFVYANLEAWLHTHCLWHEGCDWLSCRQKIGGRRCVCCRRPVPAVRDDSYMLTKALWTGWIVRNFFKHPWTMRWRGLIFCIRGPPFCPISLEKCGRPTLIWPGKNQGLYDMVKGILKTWYLSRNNCLKCLPFQQQDKKVWWRPAWMYCATCA